MPRFAFGGSLDAWAYTAGPGNVVAFAAAAVITFWDAATGGTQITDLAGAADGSSPMTQVTAGDGVASPAGNIPVFYGPNNVLAMWASANGQTPRRLMATIDLYAAVARFAAAQTWTAKQTFGPYADVNAGRMELYAEATGQVADLMTAYSGTDTGEGGARQRTFYLNEKGELRNICAKANSVGVRIKGQPSQTAHVLEQTDTGNTPIAWWEPDGRWRAPNLGHTFTFTVAGTLTVATGKFRIYNDTGVTLTIRAVRASVNTAPTGAAIRVDVNKNGTTIFTTQGNRPNIAVSTNTSKVTNMDVTTLADGDYLTVDVDVIGSTVAGADLLVQVLCY